MALLQVICIGEALIDRIINKSDSKSQNYLGGAPANVACALPKLGIPSVFIGCLGEDAYGQEFIRLFQKLKVNINFLQMHQKCSTRVVKVIRDKYGDRSFSGFENKSNNLFADEMLDKTELQKNILSLKNLFSNTKYIITGTNILTSENSCECLYFILELAKNFDIKIVVDVNWRDIFWDTSENTKNIKRSDQLKSIKNLLQYAHILKLSSEEAYLLFETNDPLIIHQMLSKRPDVIITNGSKPILWCINGKQGINKVVNSEEIIDTTGAGDAFLAGLISRLCTVSNSNVNMKEFVDFASTCGLLTCLGEGAIEPQPGDKQVYEYLDKLGSVI